MGHLGGNEARWEYSALKGSLAFGRRGKRTQKSKGERAQEKGVTTASERVEKLRGGGLRLTRNMLPDFNHASIDFNLLHTSKHTCLIIPFPGVRRRKFIIMRNQTDPRKEN